MSNQENASDIWSVSELSDRIKYSLTSDFPDVWLKGEISGLIRAASGHCYFSLKDEFAQISAIIWRTTAERMKFTLEDGQEVLCRGYVDSYPQRGTYQMIVQNVQPVGQGTLQLAFRQLHAKLENEGLFRLDHKKALPKIPRRVAVVTSPSGAAVHDFLQVIRRRWPALDVTIVPTKVQGEGAARMIASAINFCDRQGPGVFDVVVVTRGGGSIEDLWSFNEEIVCRQIYQCRIPIISAIGHEVDVTLSDLTADLRALTPTEAAERLVPDRAEMLSRLSDSRRSLHRSIQERVLRERGQLEGLVTRPSVARPLDRIRQLSMHVDRLGEQLLTTMPGRVQERGYELNDLRSRLRLSFLNTVPVARARLEQIKSLPCFSEPSHMIAARREKTLKLQNGLVESMRQTITEKRNVLERAAAQLEAFSPLAVLARGYSLTVDGTQKPIVACQSVSVGDRIQTRFADGSITSQVEKIVKD